MQQSAVNLFEALGGEPFDGVHLANRYSKLPHPAALSTFAPAGTPDGAYAITHSQTGLTLKSRVQAGRFVDAVDVYYPNGRLQSHTPIAPTGKCTAGRKTTRLMAHCAAALITSAGKQRAGSNTMPTATKQRTAILRHKPKAA